MDGYSGDLLMIAFMASATTGEFLFECCLVKSGSRHEGRSERLNGFRL